MVIAELPEGVIRLVDNRIVVGDSSWANAQPITVVEISRKKLDPRARAFLNGILGLANKAREQADDQAKGTILISTVSHELPTLSVPKESQE